MLADVRYGSKADMAALFGDVRFTPESGHGSEHSGCPLWGAWANRPSRREIVREICGVKNCTQHDKCVTCIGRANAIIGLFEGRKVR